MRFKEHAGLFKNTLLAAGVEVGHDVVEGQQGGDLIHRGSDNLAIGGGRGGGSINREPGWVGLPVRAAVPCRDCGGLTRPVGACCRGCGWKPFPCA